MSVLTFLVAECFLVTAGILSLVFIAKLASDKWTQIVTRGVAGTPNSRGAQKGIFYISWVPHQSANVALAIFLALRQLVMTNHVADPNVKLVPYFGAFLAAVAGAFNVLGSIVGFVSFGARMRRDKLRQAEAD